MRTIIICVVVVALLILGFYEYYTAPKDTDHFLVTDVCNVAIEPNSLLRLPCLEAFKVLPNPLKVGNKTYINALNIQAIQLVQPDTVLPK